MWSALFGFAGGEKGLLELQPDPSAVKSVHGFKGGQAIRVQADSVGQTIHELLDKLNKYRGPDQQIQRVWNPTTGEEVLGATVVKGEMTVLVKAASLSGS